MNDIRSRAKAFYNSLDFDKPIAFTEGLVDKDRSVSSDQYYVENIHGGKDSPDPVENLATQIDFSNSAGAYLFTGNRGTGKTTELMRLAKYLDEYGCEVFYADMSEYLALTQRVEITDFLISVLGALSEKVEQRFGEEPGKSGFFERVWSFLQSDVKFEEVTMPAGPMELKVSLTQNPTFKDELQRRTRGQVEQLVKQARDFALETVHWVRDRRGDPGRKVVLIVDSLERLHGVGDTNYVRAVFDSAATLFAANADKLRFTGLTVVYTIPPYLSALAGALGASYSGARIYTLPSVHIYERRPAAGNVPQPHDEGVVKMREMVEKRFPDWRYFFTEAQLSRLAQSSGGDLRDFFRMLRLVLVAASRLTNLPVPDALLADAENAVRNDMLPIAANDHEWLRKIMASHQSELPSLDDLPDFARLLQGKYLLQYRNGEDWFDVHPLLRREVSDFGSNPSNS